MWGGVQRVTYERSPVPEQHHQPLVQLLEEGRRPGQVQRRRRHRKQPRHEVEGGAQNSQDRTRAVFKRKDSTFLRTSKRKLFSRCLFCTIWAFSCLQVGQKEDFEKHRRGLREKQNNIFICAQWLLQFTDNFKIIVSVLTAFWVNWTTILFYTIFKVVFTFCIRDLWLSQENKTQALMLIFRAAIHETNSKLNLANGNLFGFVRWF